MREIRRVCAHTRGMFRARMGASMARAALPRGRRLALYLGLVAFILIGYIMQGGGFGGSAGFGLYANY